MAPGLVHSVSSSRPHVSRSGSSPILSIPGSSSVSQNGCQGSSDHLQMLPCAAEENKRSLLCASKSKNALEVRTPKCPLPGLAPDNCAHELMNPVSYA